MDAEQQNSRASTPSRKRLSNHTISHEHSAENLRSRQVLLLAQGHSFWKHQSSDPHFLDSETCVHLTLDAGLDSAFRMSRVLSGGSLGQVVTGSRSYGFLLSLDTHNQG